MVRLRFTLTGKVVRTSPAGGDKQPGGEADKRVIRLRFGLFQVPVLQYTDINQISSELYDDSAWRNFMQEKLVYDLLSFEHRPAVVHEHIAHLGIARVEMTGKVN
jgi:hypothetical protein